jgi:hypothetical protein
MNSTSMSFSSSARIHGKQKCSGTPATRSGVEVGGCFVSIFSNHPQRNRRFQASKLASSVPLALQLDPQHKNEVCHTVTILWIDRERRCWSALMEGFRARRSANNNLWFWFVLAVLACGCVLLLLSNIGRCDDGVEETTERGLWAQQVVLFQFCGLVRAVACRG